MLTTHTKARGIYSRPVAVLNRPQCLCKIIDIVVGRPGNDVILNPVWKLPNYFVWNPRDAWIPHKIKSGFNMQIGYEVRSEFSVIFEGSVYSPFKEVTRRN